ncbi:MAG: hypothetical protein JRI23_19940 [Deltaproteobacteria bacterium]|jgi:hypothetical protein|nr:hypothetical protein [Deltaproteobacteria bacterium]
MNTRDLSLGVVATSRKPEDPQWAGALLELSPREAMSLARQEQRALRKTTCI